MPRRVLTTIAVLCLTLVGVGCARPQLRDGPAAPAPEPAASTSEPVTYEVSAVKAVRPGPAPTTLLIDVEVPGGGDGCAQNLRADPFDEGPDGMIYVHVVFESERSGTVGACPSTAIATVTLTMPQPIGDRPLTIDEHTWTRDGAGYRQCDSDLGCTPPPDHCAAQWLRQAKSGLDIPQHSGVSVEHCSQNWLVLTVDVNTAACGVGGRPGCSAPPNVTRYFFRFDARWRVVLRTTRGGCEQIKATAPDFPTAYCQSLRPTR